jgi:dihydrofolate reductase
VGRVTYETVREFPSRPYGTRPVVVLRHHDIPIPPALSSSVERMAGPTRGWRHLNVDGGKTIQGFLAAGLISRLIINRVPVPLGSGTPLFGPLPGDPGLTAPGAQHPSRQAGDRSLQRPACGRSAR